jgi:hypothetical protein
MTLKKAIEVLTTYQAWRIGEEDVDMQKPSVVTEALNTLLDYHIVDTNEMVMSEKPTDHKEISDEEIEKVSNTLGDDYYALELVMWEKGAKWYREQLKLTNL